MARVRYGKFVVEFETDAELDSFLARHDGSGPNEEAAPKARTEAPVVNGGQAGRDQTLLKMMIQAGANGVETGTVIRLLGGPKGRGVPPAIRSWAARVGLASSDADDGACSPVKIGRVRGWRLSTGAIGAAKAMAEGSN